MSDKLLSILIPVVPGRTDRVKVMLQRINLSAYMLHEAGGLFPFEIIVVDGGSTDDLQQICMKMAEVMPLKYIYAPIGEFINAAYPRNVGLRVAQGDIITMLDADYWPSEHFLEGAIAPFIGGARDVINNGYVIDSAKSEYCKHHGNPFAVNINTPLLHPNNIGKQILGVFEHAKIPPPRPSSHIWLWAAPRKNIIDMNGYDEKFIGGYSREDDSFFYRLMRSGLRRHRDEYNKFCCIHLWHEAGQRNDQKNKLNRDYYAKMGADNPISVKRNEGREWGKLIKNSFAIIDGQMLEAQDFEKWISDNVDDIVPYLDSPTWESVAELKEYANGN